MVYWLHELDAEKLAMLIPMIGMVGGFAVAIAAIGFGQWRRVKQAEFDASLKSQMLDQGRSLEEIERVLAAGKGKKRPWDHRHKC